MSAFCYCFASIEGVVHLFYFLRFVRILKLCKKKLCIIYYILVIVFEPKNGVCTWRTFLSLVHSDNALCPGGVTHNVIGPRSAAVGPRTSLARANGVRCRPFGFCSLGIACRETLTTLCKLVRGYLLYECLDFVPFDTVHKTVVGHCNFFLVKKYIHRKRRKKESGKIISLWFPVSVSATLCLEMWPIFASRYLIQSPLVSVILDLCGLEPKAQNLKTGAYFVHFSRRWSSKSVLLSSCYCLWFIESLQVNCRADVCYFLRWVCD